VRKERKGSTLELADIKLWGRGGEGGIWRERVRERAREWVSFEGGGRRK
jgi:hypothetical protein